MPKKKPARARPGHAPLRACHHFAAGSCAYGDRCIHTHGDGDDPGARRAALAASEEASAPPRPCFAFASAGLCHYGDRCRFEHGFGEDTAARLAAVGLSPSPPAGLLALPPPPRGVHTRLDDEDDGDAEADADDVDAAAAQPSSSQPPPRDGVLFVCGIPRGVPLPAPRRALSSLLRLFGPPAPRVRLGATHGGRTRGWAHVSLPDPGLAAAAAQLLQGARLGDAWPGAVLSAGPALGKADTLFCNLPWAARAQLRLDPTALFSCLDGATADRTVDIIAALMRAGRQRRAPPGGGAAAAAAAADDDDANVCWVAADATACAGGAALALARCPECGGVDAVEINAGRAADLGHNAAVAAGLPPSRFAAHCGDWLVARAGPLSFGPPWDVVFVDPPWGGTDYRARGAIPAAGLGLSGHPLAALVADAREGRGAALVACGTPGNYDDAGLARLVTAPRPGDPPGADRALPFRLECGNRVLLLFLFPPPPPQQQQQQQQQQRGGGAEGGSGDQPPAAADSAPAAAPAARLRLRFGFPTSSLDELVALVAAWDGDVERGGGEHKPRFFDYEADRWISLGRWKGLRPAGGGGARGGGGGAGAMGAAPSEEEDECGIVAD